MSAARRTVRIYDGAMSDRNQAAYYGGSGYFNFGLWDRGATSQKEACEALVDRLLDRIPDSRGRILDVACGTGGSTRQLLRRYRPDQVCALNLSQFQLEQARLAAPGCAYLAMDAARLAFRAESFDAVLCVEAAFHFDTRAAFFREAFRVLKPGGTLVLSDMLFRTASYPLVALSGFPRANHLPDPAAYRAGLAAAGFVDAEVDDVTDASVGAFSRHLSGYWKAEREAGRAAPVAGLMNAPFAKTVALGARLITRFYLLASGRKPDR